MKLKIEKITENFFDLKKVDNLAKEAFPIEEYLAPSKMIEMSKEDGFDFLALYDEDTFIGFVTVKTYKSIAYLFFLAIDSQYRSRGYGGKAIQTLIELYPNYQHVVDMEMISEYAPNNNQRIKRKKFYLRNGYKPTGHFLTYLNIDYEILCMDDDFDFDTFKELMSSIRIPDFNPIYSNE